MCLVLTYLDSKFFTYVEIQTKIIIFSLIDVWLLSINLLYTSKLDTEFIDIFCLIYIKIAYKITVFRSSLT